MVEKVVETRIILSMLIDVMKGSVPVSTAAAVAGLVVRAEAMTLAMRLELRTGLN